MIEYLQWKIYKINLKIRKEELKIYKIQNILISKKENFPDIKEYIDICLDKIKSFELDLDGIRKDLSDKNKNENDDEKKQTEEDENKKDLEENKEKKNGILEKLKSCLCCTKKKGKNEIKFENLKDLIKIHEKLIKYKTTLKVFRMNQEDSYEKWIEIFSYLNQKSKLLENEEIKLKKLSKFKLFYYDNTNIINIILFILCFLISITVILYQLEIGTSILLASRIFSRVILVNNLPRSFLLIRTFILIFLSINSILDLKLTKGLRTFKIGKTNGYNFVQLSSNVNRVIIILALNSFTFIENIKKDNNNNSNNINYDIELNEKIKYMYIYLYGDYKLFNQFCRYIIFILMMIIFIVNYIPKIKGVILRYFKRLSFEPDYLGRKTEIEEGRKIFLKMNKKIKENIEVGLLYNEDDD